MLTYDNVSRIAQRVAAIHGLPLSRCIKKYNMNGQNPGACDYKRGEVRISLTGAASNDVYLLAHEMSHLIHADHEPDFHKLTARIEDTIKEILYEEYEHSLPEGFHPIVSAPISSGD